ncbi:MAG: OstA-like protein [Flavisolibacter sp.]
MKKLSIFFSSFFLLAIHVYAQQSAKDTTQPVEIITAKRLYLQNPDANTNVQTLAGGVQLRQGKTLFYCDSCIMNNAAKTFEAFGNVHINDNDTTNIWSNYLRYQSDKKMAYLSGNVKMTDGHATLTTPDLEYDVATKIGTYKNGGRVVNKKSVLTSKEGVYYTDVRDIYFKQNVELKDPAYYLKTDSLLYNTETQVARFIAETYVIDSSKREVRTREGYYDVAHSRSEFTSRTTIKDKAMTVTGDRIATDDSTHIMQVEGRAVLIDTAQGVNILADRIFANKQTSAYLATKKPLMIIKQDKDSIYITADTLFSARLTDLYKNSDSLLKELNLKEKDSTNRYFEAYRHVRIFSDSMQAVSDSLFYSFKDSIFHLYQSPVVWSSKSQITGDTIYLYTKNKKADRFKAFENSFMVNEVQAGVYNQVKSTRMDGFFKEGKIDSVQAKGAAESVYFIQDKDSAFTSVNQTSSDLINALFEKGELYKVVLINTVKGTVWPISQKQPSEMHLESFQWLEERRPKTKYEMFE